MSLQSRPRAAGMAAPHDREACVELHGLTSRYLTDGVELYRFLGACPSGLGQMVELEDCRSLDVVLVPLGELRSRRLRCVIPAGGR